MDADHSAPLPFHVIISACFRNGFGDQSGSLEGLVCNLALVRLSLRLGSKRLFEPMLAVMANVAVLGLQMKSEY